MKAAMDNALAGSAAQGVREQSEGNAVDCPEPGQPWQIWQADPDQLNAVICMVFNNLQSRICSSVARAIGGAR